MALHQLRTSLQLPVSLDAAWAFFSDPRNLEAITPPDMAFKIRTPLPPAAYPGLVIAYTVRPLLGVPLEWVTEITHVKEREYFVDEQRSGPYTLWHHEHHFRAIPAGVQMDDIVSYALPFGPLGDIVNALIVGARVRGIFEYRERVLHQRFGPYPAPSPAPAPPGGLSRAAL